MNTKVLGIDIAKNTFQLHGVDGPGKAALKKRLSRNQLAAYVANLPECLIVMESCGGANYWARVFQRSGHTVKLISPQFVPTIFSRINIYGNGRKVPKAGVNNCCASVCN